jgi:hypothetical protein
VTLPCAQISINSLIPVIILSPVTTTPAINLSAVSLLSAIKQLGEYPSAYSLKWTFWKTFRKNYSINVYYNPIDCKEICKDFLPPNLTHLSPVSLTSVITSNLYFQIIFGKITVEMAPLEYLGLWRKRSVKETKSWKSRVRLPLEKQISGYYAGCSAMFPSHFHSTVTKHSMTSSFYVLKR